MRKNAYALPTKEELNNGKDAILLSTEENEDYPEAIDMKNESVQQKEEFNDESLPPKVYSCAKQCAGSNYSTSKKEKIVDQYDELMQLEKYSVINLNKVLKDKRG